MHKYFYFCGCCGHYFKSDIPELNEHGLPSSISCPECGAWDIYPDTAEGARQSVKDQLAHENAVEESW